MLRTSSVYPMAFPRSDQRGMSLRDWFAGQALVGLSVGDRSEQVTAELAYLIADAMLERRAKTQE